MPAFLPRILLLLLPVTLAAGGSGPVVYTAERLARAEANLERHAWARAEKDHLQALAEQALAQAPGVLENWFSETTPTNQCSCPACGAYWLNYIWEWDPGQPDALTCNRCGAVASEKTYPPNRILYRVDPQGERRPHPVYEAEDGAIHPVGQAVAHYKAFLGYDWIEALGASYALSGDERYAKAALTLLTRLATVYPGYAWHDNFRFEPRAWGWAGKLTGWSLTDAEILIQCGTAYDALRGSPHLTAEQRHLIEESLLSLGGQMLTSVRPMQGISNDVAFRFGAVALLGRLLDDRTILAWVLDGEESYATIVDKLFFKDGGWHERAPSYHTMMLRSLFLAPYFLDGYIDPKSGKAVQLREIPKLETIYAMPFRMRFPDRSLPAINDSRHGTRIGVPGLEAMVSFFPEEVRWQQRFLAVTDGDPAAHGSLFALLNRPPDLDTRLASLPGPEPLPTVSEDFTGMGLFMLRRGKGEQQTVFTLHHHKFANSHTHYDALSTILFAEGREMLSDSGYPLFGTRQRSTWYLASLSHNTLTVDTLNQRAPNGVANFLHHGQLFAACEGESWDSYRFICEPFIRQIALVDLPAGGAYAIDIFRGGGGEVHDFALHGEGPQFQLDGLTPASAPPMTGKDYAYAELSEVRAVKAPEDGWGASWRWPDATLQVHAVSPPDTNLFVARAPGMRTRDQTGREITALFQRREGEGLRSAFTAIYEPHRGEPQVRAVQKLQDTPGSEWAVVLKVELADRTTDYILSSYLDLAPLQEVFVDGTVRIPWESRFGIVRVRDGAIVHSEWVHAPMEGLAHDL